MGTRLALRAAAASVLVAGAAAGAVSAHAAAGRTVVIKGIAYTPATSRIGAGQSVTWRWRDGSIPHDVTARGSKRFRSSSTRKRGSHTVTFRRRGTYRYYCTVHPGSMTGTVIVR
jgi:plastocyanin